MIFGNGFFPIRTDDSFRQRMQSSHHRGDCIFEELNIDMVKCFPLDPMHLVYLGVVRKLVSLWQDLAKKNEMHVDRLMLGNIDGKILDCAGMTPRDFPRKCRGLTEVSRWKATECRLFLLYLGPVVLKDIMPPAIYRNFQRLSLAVYLLSHPRFHRNYLEGCRVELINFLNEFEVIYGRKHLVYNIHCLQHLAEDVNQMGPLESFSAFPFESYMQTIRRSIHSNNAIAKQAANRFAEKVFHDCKSGGVRNEVLNECEVDARRQTVNTRNTLITSSSPDNLVIAYGRPGLITEINRDGLIFRPYAECGDFFEEPFKSSHVGIWKCSKVSPYKVEIRPSDITCKCFGIRTDRYAVAVPLPHTFP
uniref:Uncharacterized protein n=1 Tax=Trichobilharzia regenti TaxID=157069 RepID=A0AA85KH78_TRIRE|nr:unnamed protein product [Trichobilharzia regenti]